MESIIRDRRRDINESAIGMKTIGKNAWLISNYERGFWATGTFDDVILVLYLGQVFGEE
jgi:hypothetical protein